MFFLKRNLEKKIHILLNILVLGSTLVANISSAKEKSVGCDNVAYLGKKFYVSTQGSNKGNGSLSNPWKTIGHAVSNIPDGNSLIVLPGTYSGFKITRSFNKGLLLSSQYPYQATIEHNKRTVAFVGKARNITLAGFEIKHSTQNAQPLVMHIDGGGNESVNNINIINNIIHDSFNNDLLKINNGAHHISVKCNVFYNQGDSDEHIDVNSVKNIDISDNIFFNDFPKSNRKISHKSSSFIVVKDSNGKKDEILGAENIHIHRNIFLNWQGSHGHGYILIGEDGHPYYEAKNVFIYNNLLLGNSHYSMRSPLGIKGAHKIHFYHNTISGDLPSNAYALRVNQEKKNRVNTDIHLSNNIWYDYTGTMGSGDHQRLNDFSDTLPLGIDRFTLSNNIIYNGENTLPSSFFDAINPEEDSHLFTINPNLPTKITLQLPIWDNQKNSFLDGSLTIREAFKQIIFLAAIPENKTLNKLNIDSRYTPTYDIIGKLRREPFSIGAFQLNN